MTKQTRTALKWLILAVAVFWAALTSTRSAILYSWDTRTATQQNAGHESLFLVCKYFTGTGFVVKDYWNAKPRADQRCPIVVQLN